MKIKTQNLVKIIYEDASILVVDKPIKMLSHADKYKKEPDVLTQLNHPEYAVITRLDFNTSGLMLIGKTKEVISLLNQVTRNNEVHKLYQCVVVGYLQIPSARIQAYLLKDDANSVVRLSDESLPNTQKIITGYKVLKEINNFSLLEVELITGKTHQIRAHMAHIDHPLLGDPLYGNQSINKKLGIKTQLLVSSKIWFSILYENHPLYYLNQKVFEKKDASLSKLMEKR